MPTVAMTWPARDGPTDPGRIKRCAMQADGIGQVFARHEAGNERGAGRHVDRKHGSNDQGRDGQVHDMHAISDHQDRDRQHQTGQDDLSNEDHSTAVETIGQHATKGRKQQHGNRTEKGQQPQGELRPRQIENQPALRHLLHPEGDLAAGIGLPEPGILLVSQGGRHTVADPDQRPEQGVYVWQSDQRFRPETFGYRRSVGDRRGLGQPASRDRGWERRRALVASGRRNETRLLVCRQLCTRRIFPGWPRPDTRRSSDSDCPSSGCGRGRTGITGVGAVAHDVC